MDTAVKIILDQWHTNVANTSKLLNELTDEQLQADVAPGRNSGTYLLGHITAVNDRMLPLLGFGEQAYPHFNDIFLSTPDKSGKEMPSLAELRSSWDNSVTKLEHHFKNMQPADWFAKHTAISEEDFAKEPHRNRLNALLFRVNHLSNHLGQMIFLKK